MMGRHFFNQVFFDNVRVPREDLVGEENQGWYIGTTTLDFERSGIARVMGGLRTYRRLVKYCCEPQSDGQRLIARGNVRRKLAELKIEFEVGRLLSYRVAWLQAQNKVPNHEASVAKLYGSELAVRLANAGMEIAGLGGQLDSHSRFAPLGGRMKGAYLNAASLTIAAGTSEVQRNIIAGRGLGLPRD
jgi:alkylation response protein AidB-like acyl-CoA dehydrogenase